MALTDASRALEPSTERAIGWDGHTLQQMLGEQERLLAETGRYWGLDALELQTGEPAQAPEPDAVTASTGRPRRTLRRVVDSSEPLPAE